MNLYNWQYAQASQKFPGDFEMCRMVVMPNSSHTVVVTFIVPAFIKYLKILGLNDCVFL